MTCVAGKLSPVHRRTVGKYIDPDPCGALALWRYNASAIRRCFSRWSTWSKHNPAPADHRCPAFLGLRPGAIPLPLRRSVLSLEMSCSFMAAIGMWREGNG